MEIPEFSTQRLNLRGVLESDGPSYTKHFVDYEVIRNLAASVPWPYPENGVAEFIRSTILPNQGNDRWSWGIFLKRSPRELIGVIELWRPGSPENRGFWLGQAYWGRGLMTEAVVPIMNFAFDDLGFDVLVFSNALGNVRSRRIKEKTGARLVGTAPAEFVDPSFSRREIWELSKAEWLAARSHFDSGSPEAGR